MKKGLMVFALIFSIMLVSGIGGCANNNTNNDLEDGTGGGVGSESDSLGISCGAIGTSSEGWYADGKLINYAKCDGCVAKCFAGGTRSDGWVSSCEEGRQGDGGMGMGPIIQYNNCGETTKSAEPRAVPREEPNYTTAKECENLSGEPQYFCYYLVAPKINDATLCEKSSEYKFECYYKVAVNTRDMDLCEKSSDSWNGKCYYMVALGKKNTSLCEKAGSYKSECYYQIAIENHDAALCDQSETFREDCFRVIAARTHDASVCNVLPGNSFRNLFGLLGKSERAKCAEVA